MKNRYCRRTKLTEHEFELIVSQFVIGATASSATEFLAQLKHRVSRQTIEKKYLDLGVYLYERYERPRYIDLAKSRGYKKGIEKFEKMFVDLAWLELTGEIDYEALRKRNLPYPIDEKLVYILKRRRTMFMGFTRDTFLSHLGFASYSIEKAGKNAIIRWKELLKQLESDPL